LEGDFPNAQSRELPPSQANPVQIPVQRQIQARKTARFDGAEKYAIY